MKIGEAFKLAAEAHKHQKDKQNRPYIWHCIEVMAEFMKEWPDEALLDEDYLCACLLHDLYEDADYLLRTGLENELVDKIICVLTRHKANETYEEFINRICANELEIAKKIKFADLIVNHRDCPEPKLKLRYVKAMMKIMDSLHAST